MCGLAGWIAAGALAPAAAQLAAMTDSLRHRGPDGRGEACFASSDGTVRVGFGHRRLAIIDLSPGGAQPMVGPGGVAVTFNGEIYNYQDLRRELEDLGHVFASSSDTEVLLHGWRQWGEGLLPRLVGMFAFALWDPSHDLLFLARDRFGKKPLFLAEGAGDCLGFASEIKALLDLPWVERRLDPDGLAAFFAFRFVPGPTTLFRGIRKLPAGHAAVWRRGTLRQWCWYTPPDASPRDAAQAPAEPVAAFTRMLDEAVRCRMISDVPLGAFLSGGLDSSAIVALMARHSGQPVRTFSIGFADQGLNELPYARQVAQHLGCQHLDTEFSAADLIATLPQATVYRDAPVSEPADLPILLLSGLAVREVKVVLTGEGSDEVLAGYPKHRFEPWADLYQSLVPPLLHRAVVAPLVGALPWRFRRIKTLAASFGCTGHGERMARWFGALSPDEQAALTRSRFPDLPRHRPTGTNPLRAILLSDQQVWLPDNLLERGDRMTMARGLEARNPFLDHRLVALVSSLPDDCRVRGRTTKWLLRQAVAPLLPEIILKRPKIGFRLPVADWFRGQAKDYLGDMLTGPSCRSAGFYQPGAVDRVLSQHWQGRHNHEKLLWAMLALEEFQRLYGLEV